MWTYDKALALIRAYVEISYNGTAIVLEESTIDRPYGWVFFYQSRAYIETKNPLHQLVGNAPLVFNRVFGEYRILRTAHPTEQYLREYESTLPDAQLKMKAQLRHRNSSVG